MTTCAALAGLIPAPFSDIPIMLSIIGQSIISIGKFYGYVWKNISRQDLLSIYKGKIYNNNNDVQPETFIKISHILGVIKDIITNSKVILFLLNVDDILKMIPARCRTCFLFL